MTLIGFELRRIVGRRGSFFGVMVIAFLIALLFAFIDQNNPPTADDWSNIIGFPMVFGAAVVGSLCGSYDVAEGTMRYLVLTGVPRWKLVAIRAPALVAAIVLMALPAIIVAVIKMSGGDDDGTAIIRAVASGLLFPAVWGLVAMAIGALLRSNGAGIAVAIVLFLLSTGITEFIRVKVSETVGDYLLPNVAGYVAQFGHIPPDAGSDYPDMPYAAAVVALILWLIAVVGLAIARVERDEY
jgi:ABC-type transport system involved in multi-copper enzyme maturation permease subunit